MPFTIQAQRIKTRRKELKLSQEELGARVGTDQGQISRYEKGENDPSSVVIAALARALETTTDYLVGLTEKADRPLRDESDLSEDEREMIELYREVPPEKRRQIKSVARAL